MLKLWDIVLVFVSNEITVEHPLISAQPTTTNTVEYITSPAKQHIPQRRTAAWPGGVEREEGSMAFATMNASPPRNCRMRNAPAGRRYTCRMRNAPAGRRYTCRMQNAPAGRRYTCRMQNTPAGRRYTCRMRNAPAGRRYTCRMQNTPAGKGIHRMWKCSIPEGNPPHAKCSTLGRDSLPANFMLK